MLSAGLTDSAWEDTSRRTWATLTSFAVQTMGLGILLLLPLIYTQGLPQLKLLTTPIPVPAAAQPPAPAHEQARQAKPQTNMMGDQIIEPSSVPAEVLRLHESSLPAPISASELGVVGATGRHPGGVIGSLGNRANIVQPPPKPAPVSHLPRVSAMMQGYLVHRVEPLYPPLAKAARIQGTVHLKAVISREGMIENLQVLAGHPMLVTAAVAAVRQWRYRPYILNGEPVEVETEITVNFILAGS
jgi:periplasmic protein TonB